MQKQLEDANPLFHGDAFLLGKLNALRILESHFQQLHDRGVKYTTNESVANLMRTLIENLEVVFKQ